MLETVAPGAFGDEILCRLSVGALMVLLTSVLVLRIRRRIKSMGAPADEGWHRNELSRRKQTLEVRHKSQLSHISHTSICLRLVWQELLLLIKDYGPARGIVRRAVEQLHAQALHATEEDMRILAHFLVNTDVRVGVRDSCTAVPSISPRFTGYGQRGQGAGCAHIGQ